MKRENSIPKHKIETVKKLSELMKNKRTILIASIKNIPASQFQKISKNLRDKAIIKVPKKKLIFRILDSSEDEIKKLRNNIEKDIAILFSDLDCFELASELVENKTSARAKPGQEATEDIEVQAGPTNLPPGPAISELGNLGIQIQIEKGKINIKEPRIIVKKGEKISLEAADIMAKLEIKPFLVGFTPLCAFDNETKKLYLDIRINKEETIKKLKEAYSGTLFFVLELGYNTEDSIRFLLSKAYSSANRINRIITREPELVAEENSEEKKEEIKEEKEKLKADTTEGLASLFG